MTGLFKSKKATMRRVALVEEPHLRLLDGCRFGLRIGASWRSRNRANAYATWRARNSVRTASTTMPSTRGDSDWRLLPPIDHPDEAARCLVSGTGLTHLGSAQNRQAMHAGCDEAYDRQHENVPLGHGRRPARRRTQSASARNGFTKAPAQRCGRTTSRSKCRRTRKTAAKKRRSPGSI